MQSLSQAAAQSSTAQPQGQSLSPARVQRDLPQPFQSRLPLPTDLQGLSPPIRAHQLPPREHQLPPRAQNQDRLEEASSSLNASDATCGERVGRSTAPSNDGSQNLYARLAPQSRPWCRLWVVHPPPLHPPPVHAPAHGSSQTWAEGAVLAPAPRRAAVRAHKERGRAPQS